MAAQAIFGLSSAISSVSISKLTASSGTTARLNRICPILEIVSKFSFQKSVLSFLTHMSISHSYLPARGSHSLALASCSVYLAPGQEADGIARMPSQLKQFKSSHLKSARRRGNVRMCMFMFSRLAQATFV